MEHPLSDKKAFFYSGLWIVIIVLQATVVFYYYKLPFSACLADSVVFNFLTAGFCFSYWYVVRYISPASQGMTTTVITHVLGISLFVTIIIFTTSGTLNLLIKSETYKDFIALSMFPRTFLAIVYFTIVIMVYYLLLYIHQFKEKEQRETQLQSLLKQSELDMLKFQINPHFLFNSLNSISALTLIEPAQARDMVLKLANFFRSSLSENKMEVHTLQEELDQMNLYLDIEKVRFGERLVVKKEIEETCLGLTLPKMILQPLYENAIKFGMYEQLGPTTVTTTATCRNGHLQLTIKNNFEGDSNRKKGSGIGLSNVSNRLNLIYGVPHLLLIQKDSKHFSVHLTIPQAS